MSNDDDKYDPPWKDAGKLCDAARAIGHHAFLLFNEWFTEEVKTFPKEEDRQEAWREAWRWEGPALARIHASESRDVRHEALSVCARSYESWLRTRGKLSGR